MINNRSCDSKGTNHNIKVTVISQKNSGRFIEVLSVDTVHNCPSQLKEQWTILHGIQFERTILHGTILLKNKKRNEGKLSVQDIHEKIFDGCKKMSEWAGRWVLLAGHSAAEASASTYV